MSDSKAETDDSIRRASQVIHDKLLPSSEVRSISDRSDLAGAQHFILHVGLWLVLSYLSFSTPPLLSWACFILQCFVMSFLFMPEHECSHMTAFQSQFLNTFAGHFLGLVVFRPFRHYRFYHFNHHKFTGNPEMDPEMQDSFIDLRLDNWMNYVMYLTSIPFWIDRFTTLVRHGVLNWVLPREDGFLTKRTRPQMIDEARCYVAFYALLALFSYYTFDAAGPGYFICWGWFIPTLFAQPFLRFYLVAEHTGCPIHDNMLSNTRTTRTFWWYRWLAWNMPYHAEHHGYPSVPFHQLPLLHRKLASKSCQQFRLCNPNGENGYLGVHIGLIRKFSGRSSDAKQQ